MKTRQQKTRALLQNLKDGPVINPIPFTTLNKDQTDEIKRLYQAWVNYWILPVVEDLLKHDIQE